MFRSNQKPHNTLPKMNTPNVGTWRCFFICAMMLWFCKLGPWSCFSAGHCLAPWPALLRQEEPPAAKALPPAPLPGCVGISQLCLCCPVEAAASVTGRSERLINVRNRKGGGLLLLPACELLQAWAQMEGLSNFRTGFTSEGQANFRDSLIRSLLRP